MKMTDIDMQMVTTMIGAMEDEDLLCIKEVVKSEISDRNLVENARDELIKAFGKFLQIGGKITFGSDEGEVLETIIKTDDPAKISLYW